MTRRKAFAGLAAAPALAQAVITPAGPPVFGPPKEPIVAPPQASSKLEEAWKRGSARLDAYLEVFSAGLATPEQVRDLIGQRAGYVCDAMDRLERVGDLGEIYEYLYCLAHEYADSATYFTARDITDRILAMPPPKGLEKKS